MVVIKMDIVAFLMSPISMMIIGVIVGGFVCFLIAYMIFKGRQAPVFEFVSFEDTVMENLDDTFKLQGKRSKAKLTHGINNPIGSVDKWLMHKGEWSMMVYDPKQKKYIPKTRPVKVEILGNDGKPKKDAKGKVSFEVKNEAIKEKYDLFLFKVKGGGIFESSNYVVADSKYIEYNPKLDRFNIDANARLNSFGKAWITSVSGEKYLCDISFRKSIEGNMTYLQNYARKIIFVETSHAKAISKLEGKTDAKTAGYQAFATNALVRDAQSTDDED